MEDDRVLRDVMVRSLGEAGHRVDVAETVEQAEHFWRVQMFDAVLLDLNLPLSGAPHSGPLVRAATACRRQFATRHWSVRLLEHSVPVLQEQKHPMHHAVMLRPTVALRADCVSQVGDLSWSRS